ncbi:MAG: prepilin-type N-terminal cleavage/methylation domain-containing protein [Pirellulaceae bacterium]|nr:prepilin-type N-terminal cleavage/methylation domain-containing protein [Pirellulaceae bacterium]
MTEPISNRQRSQCSAGYTLLELMLALALLGALMTVAWSLMGTFRDAEQRGWKLSHRVQTIRVARQWLQSDLQQLVHTEPTPATGAGTKSRLSGNALGFTASISPSIDPLPFLENLMSNPSDGISSLGTNSMGSMAEQEPSASLYSDNEAIIAEAQRSLWPAETMEIEYKLTPIEDTSTTAEMSLLQPTDLSSVQFTLTRSEMLDASAMQRNPNAPPGAASGAAQTNNLADRVLTAQDLYRQTDETTRSSGTAIRETRLDGLTNVQFQYFDGVSWRREWNSDQTGGLPIAIALCFDFPATADIKPVERIAPSSAIDGGLNDPNDALSSNPLGAGMSFADSALAAEPTLESTADSESGLMQSPTHEIQIVVYVGGQAKNQTSRQVGTPRGRTRGGF